MNKDKRNNIKLLGTLNNADESGIIANANQIYDANENKSTQDVSKEHTEHIKILETKENSMQTTLENITKTGEASAASNVTYNHNDSKLNATNVQQAIDEVSSIGHFAKRGGVINISTNYNSDHIAEVLTLSQAIAKVPSSDRILGFTMTFLSSDGWKNYQFIGTTINNWTDINNWTSFVNDAQLKSNQNSITEKLDTKVNTSAIVQQTGDSTTSVMSQKAVKTEFDKKIDKSSITQESGTAEDKVMSQKATTNAIADETKRAKAAEQANSTAIQANSNNILAEVTRAKAAEKLNSQATNILKEKTSKISKEVVEDGNEEIIIEDDNSQELLHFKNGKLRVQEIETQKLNLSSSLNTDINISSDASITIENGRCCSFIEGGSYLIKGIGNATINVSFTNKTFADVSYGFMWPWNSQLIASLNVQGITIGKYDSGSPATYKLQGETFQRINKHDSSSDAIFQVNSDSNETWSLLITKKAEKFIKPSVKPICIVYDGGRWQGQVYWEGELYKIWDLHRKLDIPYAVALYSGQMNPESGNEYTCDEVRRDIETGLCEVIIRNAGVTKTTDLEYLETIESERSLLKVKSKATILAQHVLNPLIYRCSIKDGADFIRQYTSFSDEDGVIAYKYSDSSYKAIHSMGFPTILKETNNFWLPEIFWAHGVGIPPEGDTISYMYGDTTGVNTEKWFKNILPLVENGKVQILHPSDFSQYCRNIK